eukprot:CAMPEP_0168448282 /NCGR_PEP_ID=MMETSP0228-20121227/47015_1 /TAXON_ID=133427 /ORGANISM="Protoceratium reticulatum, Strain CCCM 535 (=CCMP 1889)" /LENGTH=119 /DNA_ID=CAMNT_0008462813 /DNA_START=39 /DNA_END=398 /DNA_ORIENTATION=+
MRLMLRPSTFWVLAALVASVASPSAARAGPLRHQRDSRHAPAVGAGSDLALVLAEQALPATDRRVKPLAEQGVAGSIGYSEDSLHAEMPKAVSALQLPPDIANQATNLAYGDNDDVESF